MLHLKTSGLIRNSVLLSFALAGIASCSDNDPASVEMQAGGAGSSPSAADIHEFSLVLDAHADIVIPSTSGTSLFHDINVSTGFLSPISTLVSTFAWPTLFLVSASGICKQRIFLFALL